VFVSCGKLNPEDPYLPHFNHLNERLEGEWELEKIYINLEDSSSYLDIDTINIARHFKFVPTTKKNALEGEGNFFIKSSDMAEYPEKIAISLSLTNNYLDTNYANASMKYRFREGTANGKSYMQISFVNIELVDENFPSLPTFKPIFKNKIIDNFYFISDPKFSIIKATKNKLILLGSALTRYEFKKIKE
jgi:hypothetical protein